MGWFNKDVLKWIWTNISTIKDILWIIFTFIATFIAILTYRRAKYTILQPLRTEVIKKQTELFVEIIENFSDDIKFIKDIDRMNMIEFNTYYVLDLYGFKSNLSGDLNKILNEVFCSYKLVKRGNELHEIRLPELFDDSKKQDEMHKSANDSIQTQLETGEIDIELLGITKKCQETLNKYNNIANNAFLPSEIKIILDEIIVNIEKDIAIGLKEVLEQVILEAYEKSQKGEKFSVNTASINNLFIKKRPYNYSQLIKKIRKSTRDYLMIDRKWK